MQIAKIGKINLLYLNLDILRRAVAALAIVIFPQHIIKYLLNGQYSTSVLVASLLCIILMTNEILFTFIEGNNKILRVDIINALNRELGKCIMECEYGIIEKNEYVESIEFSRKCIERNSVLLTYNNTSQIVAGTISLIGTSVIISRLPLWLIGVIWISAGVSTVGEIFRLKYEYDRSRGGTSIERNLYYARNDLSGNKYAKDIRIWDLYNYVSRKVEQFANELCELWAKTAIRSIKVIGWTYLIKGIQYIIVYVFLISLVVSDMIDAADFILYSSAAITFADSLKNILNSLINISAEYDYIAGSIEIINGKKHEDSKFNEETIKFNTSIEFVDVWFRYNESEEYILKGLNLKLEKNRSYSLVGRNGSGKSTLIKLLIGLYEPEKGEILIDNVSLKKLCKRDYRRIFSCVFQDYNIFGFKLAENITLSSNVNEKRIRKVIESVGLEKKVENMINGMDTLLNPELNDDAVMLSGGQEQELAIARALYREAEFYILDEPTAALSPSSEYKIYQQVKKLAKNKTLLFISHRLSSCILCDEVIVMKNGEISEKGSHKALMENNGEYAQLFSIQAEPYV